MTLWSLSETWQEHLKQLEEVFRHLQDADLKIKCSKFEIFKSKVCYIGFLVGTDGVQPLQVAVIEALEPPKDIDELRQFLDLVGFYRKFIPFFTDVTPCLNTMLREGAVFKWTEWCNNAFRFLMSELVKMPRLHIQILTNSLCCSQTLLNIVILTFFIKRRHPTSQVQRSTSFP